MATEAKVTLSKVYDKCTVTRQVKVASVTLYDLDVVQYGMTPTEPFFFVFCETNDFKKQGDLQGKIRLLDPFAVPGRTLDLFRDQANIWPFLPTTLFNPQGTNTVGVLWVKPSFFVSEAERNQFSRPTVKWPIQYGDAGDAVPTLRKRTRAAR